MATTTDDRPTTRGTDRIGAGHGGIHSVRDMFTIHREGPVTSRERVRSAIGAVVALLLLAAVVGVIHLIDGSRRFDGSDLVTFGVVGAVLAVIGYAFPRFTTTPGLAMWSRSPDRGSTASTVALVVVGLMMIVVGAAKFYY